MQIRIIRKRYTGRRREDCEDMLANMLLVVVASWRRKTPWKGPLLWCRCSETSPVERRGGASGSIAAAPSAGACPEHNNSDSDVGNNKV